MDLRRLGLGIAAFSLVAACAPDGELGETSDEAQTGVRTITPDRVAEDSDIRGGENITAEDVQAFLESKNSALATYKEDGRSAAQLIVEESRQENISPVYMLVRIETESSLVTSGTFRNMKSATGCGCPDTAACDPAHANFGPQVRCAAITMRKYYTQLEKGPTVSGWRVGTAKQTLDPCTITPANKATAALYTYTPWVGAYGTSCGTAQWGGTSLIGRLFASYKTSFRGKLGAGNDGSEVPDAGTDGGKIGSRADGGTTAPEAGTADAGRADSGNREPPELEPDQTTELPDDGSDDDGATDADFENPPVEPGKPRTGKTSASSTTRKKVQPFASSEGCSSTRTGGGRPSPWLPLALVGVVLAAKRRRSAARSSAE